MYIVYSRNFYHLDFNNNVQIRYSYQEILQNTFFITRVKKTNEIFFMVYTYNINNVKAVVATITSILRLRVVSITDARVTMMNEIINSIALIKMYSWEDPFISRVEDLR